MLIFFLLLLGLVLVDLTPCISAGKITVASALSSPYHRFFGRQQDKALIKRLNLVNNEELEDERTSVERSDPLYILSEKFSVKHNEDSIFARQLAFILGSVSEPSIPERLVLDVFASELCTAQSAIFKFNSCVSDYTSSQFNVFLHDQDLFSYYAKIEVLPFDEIPSTLRRRIFWFGHKDHLSRYCFI